MAEKNMPALPPPDVIYFDAALQSPINGWTESSVRTYAIAYAEQRVREAAADAARYRAFFDAGLSVTFMGETFSDKEQADAAIDTYISKRSNQ